MTAVENIFSTDVTEATEVFVHLVVKYYDEYYIYSTMSELLGGGAAR
jgi:hypothetical protein